MNTSHHVFNQLNDVYDDVNGQVGYANQAPVPGPLPLAGAAFTYRWSRRLRSRLRREVVRTEA